MIACGYVAAQSGVTVSVGGRLASSDVIERGGKVYVPITDLAQAFDRTVVRTQNGYDLIPVGAAQVATAAVVSGAAVQVDGLTGVAGETLNSGQVSLTVMRVVRGEKYVSAITGKTFNVPDTADTEIVAVVCRLKNVLKKPRSYDLGRFKAEKTVLTDAQGRRFTPTGWDRQNAITTVPALSTVDFAVLFAVPKNVDLRDFLYEVRPNDFDRSMRRDVFRVQRIQPDDRAASRISE